jgi:nucleoside-diphosphate-sugar epimerase
MSCGNTRRWKNWPKRANFTHTNTKASGNVWIRLGICATSNPSGKRETHRGRHGERSVDNSLAEDLDHILAHTRNLWEELRDQRIFITGGTGFFGCWLLESFAWANDKLNLNAEALVLSRSPEAFEKKAPHLYHHPAIQFLKGNVQDFDCPEGRFSHLIHGAVYQKPADAKDSDLCMVHEMLPGTRRVLEFCVKAKVSKTLLISTGAVYGPPPSSLEKIHESFSESIAPSEPAGAYHHVRRMMELLGVLYAVEHRFEVKIARGFSFIGAYLPLNGRFAGGDFIGDALSGNPVAVKGNGKPIRSYLYAADLAIWLWTILFKGKSCRPYNVGSEIPTTILELAEKIAGESDPPLNVNVSGKSLAGVAPDRYLPDTTRAQTELGLNQFINLESAIRKTLNWHKSKP